MEKKGHEGGGAREETVVRQESILELVFTHHVLGESDVDFVFRAKNLDILKTIIFCY